MAVDSWLSSEVIRDTDGLASIIPDWERLATPSGTPLLSHDWCLCSAEALHAEGQLLVIAVRRGGRVSAIAPLVLSRKKGTPRIEFLGVSSLFEPCGFLYEDHGSLAELVRAIIKTGYPAVLQRMPESIMDDILKDAWAGAICMRTRSASTPFVRICQSWEEYLGSISQKRRYDLRRARKRAEEFGPLSTRIFCPRPEELQAQLEEVYAIEASNWKGRNGSAILKKKPLRDFFSSYARRACGEGILRLCFLESDGKAVASQIALEYDRRFWVLKIGYDERYAKCSPGVLLTMETLRYSFEKGLDAYEFLGSAEQWIEAWTREEHPYGNLFIYPFSARGFAGLAADAPRLLIKRLAGSGKDYGEGGRLKA